ncbi:MAG: hypothetical protein E4H10_00355 [Bacteroidia bacterium]|nr:MAG: hypothetical protein E4H10_00355 [Bacteroidia bacterium]
MASAIKKSNLYLMLIPVGMLSFLLSVHSCEKVDDQSPVIKTIAITSMEDGSYKISGTLTLLGTEEITEHGVCWNESGLPDIHGPSTKLGPLSIAGEFSSIVPGLEGNKTYYFRAYVVANSVPIYGNEKAFITELGSDNRVSDVEGNIYRTVKIGEQTWMAENLKVTKYADGTPIPHVAAQEHWFELHREDLAYCWYDNLIALGYESGALYSWPAASRDLYGSDLNPSEIQGVCPDGWHLPSDSEWDQLEMYLGMDPEELDKQDWRGTDEGGKLKPAGTRDWLSPNTGATGETGFNAQPGGYRHGSGAFIGMGTTARYWTATKNGYSYGWYRQMDYDNSAIGRDFQGVYRGHSVRCVKDE